MVLKAQGRILTGWTTNSQYPGNANDPPTSPLLSTVAGRDTSIELIPYGSARLRVTEFPWINTPVGVLSHTQIFKEQGLMINIAKNGKCSFTVNTSGHFALALRDIAGRTVYHLNAVGPKSLVLARGMLHSGIYVANLTSGNGKFEKKILITQ